MCDYMHPGYRKLYPIQTVLRDLAAQEGCDGEPYDAMVFAAGIIDDLQRQLQEHKTQGEDNMSNASLYMALIDDTVKLVDVQFHNQERGEFGGKTYTYKTDIDLHKHDIVVVEAREWFAVARVVDDNVMLPMDDDTTKFRWVVQHLNIEDHKSRIAFEQDVVRNVNDLRRKQVRAAVFAELGLTQEGVDKIKALARHDTVIVEETNLFRDDSDNDDDEG